MGRARGRYLRQRYKRGIPLLTVRPLTPIPITKEDDENGGNDRTGNTPVERAQFLQTPDDQSMQTPLTPAQIIDGIPKQPLTPDKMSAFFSAAEIAIKAVYRAAHAGNVQCNQAAKEMEPFMEIMRKK